MYPQIYFDDIFGVCTYEVDTKSANEYWLDSNCPYAADIEKYLSWNDNPENHVDHSDSPGLGSNLCSSISIEDHFKTYLQFQPNTSGRIPVTIGRVDWGWSCTAIEIDKIWSKVVFSYGPDQDWSDNSFPYWSHIYSNN